MFTVFFSQKLSSLATLLIRLQQNDPNPNPFEPETVLVQSVGMAQWLQMQIADQTGIAGNYQFPFPTSFLWQQYRVLFPELPKENIFERERVTWRLMRLIPSYLHQSEFEPLNLYLNKDMRQYQLKLYQLAGKIADLFDQYLVYRPHWLVHWESGQIETVLKEILTAAFQEKNEQDILANLRWQATLWNALVEDIKADSDEKVFMTSHRAYLQQQYFDKLDNLSEAEQAKLPKRIFVFGISSLPATQLAVLKKLSEHCDIYLFFLDPSQEYWADSVEDKSLEKLALKQQLSRQDLDALLAEQGNQLLTMWGKQGREFLAQLVEQEPDNTIDVFDEYAGDSNLTKLKNAILHFNNEQCFELAEQDQSIQIHSCHSVMREVEVLHNKLLQMFEQNPALTPKDIIVMSADIDKYAPYINAVFARYERGDKRYIPFTLSDQKVTAIDPIIASFLTLLNLKESNFNAESLLDLLDVNALRTRFHLQEQDLQILRDWINQVGIRFGLNIQQDDWQNHNAWENGLTRLLLGTSLKEESGIWQDSIAFNESYGLSATLVGFLAKFIENLTAWYEFIQQDHTVSEWQARVQMLIGEFYQESDDSLDAILLLNETLNEVVNKAEQAKFTESIGIEIIRLLLEDKLNQQQNSLHFLAGKVNFCTLLPMRAIPFKVVCLLGMNEADFPRQHSVNSFDLMQYAPKRGDRARRDDDRYLFLEALLSAQEIFYLSYIGQSATNNKQRLPSVLVSQLLDYLAEHLTESSRLQVSENERFSESLFLQKMVVKQPLTVFSPKNFTAEYASFDKEWLLDQAYESLADFLYKPLDLKGEIPTEINLEDLIAFVSNPIKYFFNHQLGVYFRNNEESIEESEKFSLNKLDDYQLRQHLVTLEPAEREAFFKQEQLKGNLPIANFAKVSVRDLEDSVNELRELILPYLGESDILDIEQLFEVNQLKIRLFGNIQNKFANEIVFWKVSSLKDKDYIRLWIFYLVIKAQDLNIDLKAITRNKDGAEIFQFSQISTEQARSQLHTYVVAYLAAFRKLTFGIWEGLDNYFERQSEEQTIEEYCQQQLLALMDKQYFEGSYLQRILQQSSQLDYAEIHTTTLEWFELMQQSKPKKAKIKEKR
ncbi:exodeoxyribonuclease V subunit gamma [Actinobacillus arthritidis]|uniref:exodeoxyribonuclease V subunit gamma n=1 Tax=Actinobacillus arthritidis TaxID=157339 RepID=UPI002441448C|nr:exodeoxyribonuclease V subunit gamma [Actinobacillus arthritidis]WGE88932.1 exodeoxyribonuclease V subunit gamma [Actinobacillus arthritidis]